jgi:hypothetical protein
MASNGIGMGNKAALTAMVCVLDLQVMMLMHLTCDEGDSYWLWLESSHKITQWKARRRAIVASAIVSSDELKPKLQEG